MSTTSTLRTLLVLFSSLQDILDALDWDLELGLELGRELGLYAPCPLGRGDTSPSP